ncbi:MAG: CHAD domain-containing protein [Acidobacteriaceae bacterium]|nr:CHAD domain-containing protein [Acidobacteriaceae bacterium]
MPYRLKRGESVPEGIRRIVQEEIDSASDQLNHANGKKRDEAIHEARKSLKKIRGTLRLMEPELGRVYRAENTRLSELGRKLSEIRDAAAIIEVFSSLVEKYNGSLQKNAFASIRRGLEKSKRETEERANLPRLTQRALSTLRITGKRAGNWPLETDGFAAIEPGLELRYRRGRQAMAVAEKDPTPQNYHEWRKRVKDHWYHIRLLESLWTDVMRAREGSLKNLETWLGDDHNLVVLREKLDQNPEAFGEAKDLQLFATLMDQHQKELRDNALSIGQRVYEEKPRQFTRNLEKLWDAWQNQPDSMKEVQKEQRNGAKKQPGRATQAPARKTAVA